ncbi:kh domain containing protein, partial [Nannochloropsis gaditana]
MIKTPDGGWSRYFDLCDTPLTPFPLVPPLSRSTTGPSLCQLTHIPTHTHTMDGQVELSAPVTASTSRKRNAPASTPTTDQANEGLLSSQPSAAKRQSTGAGVASSPPPRAHEVTVLLPIDAVGLMIGKGGQTLKRLLEEGNSACAIRVQDYQEVRAGSKERGIILRGSFEAIENVERAMIDLLRHRRQKAVDAKREREEAKEGGKEGGKAGGREGEERKRKTLRWLIPAELSGLLIGKKGIGREEIQQESGAKRREG